MFSLDKIPIAFFLITGKMFTFNLFLLHPRTIGWKLELKGVQISLIWLLWFFYVAIDFVKKKDVHVIFFKINLHCHAVSFMRYLHFYRQLSSIACSFNDENFLIFGSWNYIATFATVHNTIVHKSVPVQLQFEEVWIG